MSRANWPAKLPKQYHDRPFLTVADLATIGGVSHRAILRFWIVKVPGAAKIGPGKNAAFVLPAAGVIAFLSAVNAK